MAAIIDKRDLPDGATSRQFEGYRHGDVNISFFLTDTPPGRGPALHKHPYEEVFIVQAGMVTFTVGDETLEASQEQIVIVPAGVPHKFANSGTETARLIAIHANARMVTEWLEERQ
jgi:mannose-6-phosphate isomerase-like protein (cupin superfamily)